MQTKQQRYEAAIVRNLNSKMPRDYSGKTYDEVAIKLGLNKIDRQAGRFADRITEMTTPKVEPPPKKKKAAPKAEPPLVLVLETPAPKKRKPRAKKEAA